MRENYEIENMILNEEPYNWKKHFLYDLPSILYFLIKVAIVMFAMYIVTYSLASALIEKLPSFCTLLK